MTNLRSLTNCVKFATPTNSKMMLALTSLMVTLLVLAYLKKTALKSVCVVGVGGCVCVCGGCLCVLVGVVLLCVCWWVFVCGVLVVLCVCGGCLCGLYFETLVHKKEISSFISLILNTKFYFILKKLEFVCIILSVCW